MYSFGRKVSAFTIKNLKCLIIFIHLHQIIQMIVPITGSKTMQMRVSIDGKLLEYLDEIVGFCTFQINIVSTKHSISIIKLYISCLY